MTRLRAKMTDVATSTMPSGLAWSRSAAAGLTFRPAVENDMAFLRTVYASTRQAELDLVDWTTAQKEAFVEMQFQAQDRHYRLHHADMDWLIVAAGNEPAGRLYLDRRTAAYSIVDIAFLPEHRGKGLGAALIRDLQDEAGDGGRSITIHVEKFNPAMRLYHRLGFRKIEDKGIYNLMAWFPDQAKTAS